MISAVCLVSAVMLAQVPDGPPPSRIASLSRPSALDDPAALDQEPIVVTTLPRPPESSAAVNVPPATPAPTHSFFSRSPFSDRNGIGFITSAGPGRFNIIDWESRPSLGRYWWLSRWSAPDEVQFNFGIGFNIHWWAGPVQDSAAPPPNLPAQVFDLYLDLSWGQRWTDRLASEVRVRPGLYTDFRTTPPDAARIPGEAAFVYTAAPDLFLVGGVQYLQRLDIQLLPIAGILWRPTPRWELSLLFPEPKIAYELSPNKRLWGYAAAEYGGGRWTYKNDFGGSERVESSDVRALCGLEWRQPFDDKLPFVTPKTAAFLEVGYVFERHLRFAGPVNSFQPEAAWLIRFGTAW
jgi:hypothetical protein